ncbi:MAG TPA: GreA/GreB family elongation factor [Lacunisphaera sp.]|nr:GreA/GreB family elongation factor [Lacunisphaera sp.]
MSKAFTREDDTGDLPLAALPRPLLPPGVKNYLTPGGHARLRAELGQLRDEERPVLVEGSLTDPELRRELAQLDQRIAILERSLATAEVVPPAPTGDQVRFGSKVTVRDSKGALSTYRIVGVDEADFAREEVSWRSPIASALLNARLGERVPFKFPSGATELEIVKIE